MENECSSHKSNTPQLGCAASQTSPVRIQSISFRRILIFFPFFLGIQSRLFLSGFSGETQHEFIFYRLCRVSLPSHPSPFHHFNNTNYSGTQVKFDGRI